MTRAKALFFFLFLLMTATFPGCASMSSHSSTDDRHPWKRSAVFFYIDADLPANILTEEFEEAWVKAFSDWNELYCKDWPVFIYGGKKKASFVQDGKCKDGESIPVRGAIFITVKHQRWDDKTNYLGVAYTCYETDTKRRISTAIALNFVNFRFAKLGEQVPDDVYDLRRLIMHEAGHAVTVDHHKTPDKKHTMSKYVYYGPYQGLSPEDAELACPTSRRASPTLLTRSGQ